MVGETSAASIAFSADPVGGKRLVGGRPGGRSRGNTESPWLFLLSNLGTISQEESDAATAIDASSDSRTTDRALSALLGRAAKGPLASLVAAQPTPGPLRRRSGGRRGWLDRRRHPQAGPPLQRRRPRGGSPQRRQPGPRPAAVGGPAGAAQGRAARPRPRRRPVDRAEAGPAHRRADRPADAPGDRLGVAAQARLHPPAAPAPQYPSRLGRGASGLEKKSWPTG